MRVYRAGPEVVNADQCFKYQEVPIHLLPEFASFFKQKVNIPFSTFTRQLQKKKQNFLVRAQVNSIMQEEERKMQ